MGNYTLITGATGGLGKAFAVECASRGQNLILTDLSKEKLGTLAKSLALKHSIDVKTISCDLMKVEEREKLFEELNSFKAELYMTINVAGLDFEGGVETLNSKKISKVIRINTEATLDITRFVSTIEHSGDFYIINVASMAGFYAMPLKALYSASKRAIIQFSLAVREEIREKGGHILVLCPAGLRTTRKVRESIEAQGIMGKLTTVELGTVVYQTLNRALMDKPKYVPGWINVLIVGFSSLAPETVKARYCYKRWKDAHRKKAGGKIPKPEKAL